MGISLADIERMPIQTKEDLLALAAAKNALAKGKMP